MLCFHSFWKVPSFLYSLVFHYIAMVYGGRMYGGSGFRVGDSDLIFPFSQMSDLFPYIVCIRRRVEFLPGITHEHSGGE